MKSVSHVQICKHYTHLPDFQTKINTCTNIGALIREIVSVMMFLLTSFSFFICCRLYGPTVGRRHRWVDNGVNYFQCSYCRHYRLMVDMQRVCLWFIVTLIQQNDFEHSVMDGPCWWFPELWLDQAFSEVFKGYFT